GMAGEGVGDDRLCRLAVAAPVVAEFEDQGTIGRIDLGAGRLLVAVRIGHRPASVIVQPAPAAPAARGWSTAIVIREMQVISPASLRNSICQTWVERPTWIGRAMPVTQPAVTPLR